MNVTKHDRDMSRAALSMLHDRDEEALVEVMARVRAAHREGLAAEFEKYAKMLPIKSQRDGCQQAANIIRNRGKAL